MVCLRRPYHFNFLKAVFHKLYLVHSWILCPIWNIGVNFQFLNPTFLHMLHLKERTEEMVRVPCNDIFWLTSKNWHLIDISEAAGLRKTFLLWSTFLVSCRIQSFTKSVFPGYSKFSKRQLLRKLVEDCSLCSSKECCALTQNEKFSLRAIPRYRREKTLINNIRTKFIVVFLVFIILTLKRYFPENLPKLINENCR